MHHCPGCPNPDAPHQRTTARAACACAPACAQFTDTGGQVEVSVAESADTREGWRRVHVRVTDNGIGLDQTELEKLRAGDVFTQVGRGQMQGSGGTGLGLNITRHILQLHNNSVLSLHSVGHTKGTCFELQLSLPEEGREGRSSNQTTPDLPSRFGDAHRSPASQNSNVNSNAQTSNEIVATAPFRELACLHVEVRTRAAGTGKGGPLRTVWAWPQGQGREGP